MSQIFRYVCRNFEQRQVSAVYCFQVHGTLQYIHFQREETVAAGEPRREEIISAGFLPPGWRRLTSSGWLISNRSSLLLFHCWMTLASFSRSSSSGIVVFSPITLSVKTVGKQLSYASRVDVSTGPHPYFSVHPASSKPILTSLRVPSPASLCPHFTGQQVLVMWSKQFPNTSHQNSVIFFLMLIVSMR